MRILDIERDRRFYDKEHAPTGFYEEDPLDLWRFNILQKLLHKRDRKKNSFKDRRVLNIAGGWGREAYLILSEGASHLTLCDYSHTQTVYAERYLQKFKNRSIVCCNGEALPFKDKSVDICIIAEGLHHFLDPVTGIKEMIRVAKNKVVLDEPGGGIFRSAINDIFVTLGIKERLERGYLQEYRLSKKRFVELGILCSDIIYFPYFIYYFGWYKNKKWKFCRKIYQTFLSILNIFFHFLGNRVIVVLDMTGN